MEDRIENAQHLLCIASKYKFLVHEAKGDWHYKDVDNLLAALCAEVVELEQAIKSEKREAILSELGDCFNYLIMLADKLSKH